MKRLWLAILLMVALVCWGSSAGAARPLYGCPYCGELQCNVYYMEGDGHHWEKTTKCGYIEQLPHNVECEDLGKCIDCGSTTNLGSAEITHIRAHQDKTNWIGMPIEDYIYTFDEYRHTLKCFCGEVTFEDDYHTPPSCYSAGAKARTTCQYCDVENAKILEERMKHWFIRDDGSCSCGYNPNKRLPGDADNNSSVTLADARAILDGSVSNESNADVTGDGKVDQQDVLRIMQYISGWDVTLQ